MAIGALVALAANAQETQTATLGGSVKGFGLQPLVICEMSSEGSKPDTLKLSAKGEFSTTVDLTKPSEGFLRVIESDDKNETFCIYLAPNKSLKATVSKGKEGGITAKFGGDTGLQTEYNNASRNLFTLSKTFSEDEMLKHADFNAWRGYVKGQLSQLDKVLAKVKDADFVAAERRSLDDGLTGLYFNYATTRQRNGHDMEQDAAFMDFVKTINMNDTLQLRGIMDYVEWWQTAHPDTSGLPKDAAKLRMLKTLTQSQDVRNQVAHSILSFQFMAQMFGADMSSVLPYIYKEFIEVSTDKDLCDYARKELSVYSNQAGGKEAYALPLHTLDGTQTTLKDIVGNGKYTYVDFWATWCGPCKREIPHFARLAEKFKDAPVRFVSISIDVDCSKWETMVKKDQPQWPQYRATKEGQRLCVDVYGITGIPRFMLFDKEGRMMDSSATRPSEEKTEKLIETLK